jgi:hypothetical protein
MEPHDDYYDLLPKEGIEAYHLKRSNSNGEIKWRPIFGLFTKFSGQLQDWCNFEEQFKSVAASLGLAYIFQEHEFIPMTPLQKLNIAMI